VILETLAFVRKTLDQVESTVEPTEYRWGYVEALKLVEDFIATLLWENGVDDPGYE